MGVASATTNSHDPAATSQPPASIEDIGGRPRIDRNERSRLSAMGVDRSLIHPGRCHTLWSRSVLEDARRSAALMPVDPNSGKTLPGSSHGRRGAAVT